MNESNQPVCPECGKTLPEGSIHGLCPACLMSQAMASGTFGTMADGKTSLPLPRLEEIAGKFPHFDVVECLGRGGMGVVYKAWQKSLDRWVAIKVLAPERKKEERFAEHFEREAKTLARMSHPNIVTVFDHGEVDELFYIVMEFVDGVNLRDLLREGKMEPEQALAIVPPVCDALEYAHDKGVVHRDIKPENLLLDREGRVKIADFGIASLVGASGEKSGTPPYMAPEQEKGTVDRRADIYALGVVLYEMLTGERPGKELEPPSKKVEVDVRLDEVVLRALEKKPELRYQQASVFKTQVETIVADTGKSEVGSQNVEGGSPHLAASARPYNSWEPSIIFAGTMIFLAMPLFGLEASPPFVVPLILLSIVGLVICAISWAGRWPFPSPLFPEPNFSSRNLRRHKGTIPPQSETHRRFLPTATSSIPQPDVNCPLTMESWLALMDTGDYAESWKAAATNFQASSTREEWVENLEKVRRPLGEILSRKLVSMENTVEGRRYVAKYASSFAGLPSAIETINYDKQASGEWLPTGYLIRPAEPEASRISRTAIWGAVWLVFTLLTELLFFLSHSQSHGHLSDSLEFSLRPQDLTPVNLFLLAIMMLGHAGFAGAPILSWIAVSQIRRSAGRLHGLGLAVFDGLLFPLLVLAALLWFIWMGMLDWGFPVLQSIGIHQPSTAFSLVLWTPWLLASLLLSTWIVRMTWRLLIQTDMDGAQLPGDSETVGAITPIPRRMRKALATIGTSLVVLTAATFLLFWVQRPQLYDDKTITADSPDGMSISSGQTWHAMRIFGGDRTFYRFVVQGKGGSVFEDWEVPVPIDTLASSYVAMSMDEISFANNGRIVWSEDSKRVSFQVNGVEVSAFDTETHRPTDQAAVSAVDAGTATFGPVIERVVNDDSSGATNFLIDLDSGRLTTPPSPKEADWDWVVANGIDATGDMSANVRGMVSTGGTVVVPVASDAWEVYDAFAVRQIVVPLSSTLQGSVAIPGKDQLPATFVFKTREDGIGLLQITGFTDNPPGVNIRYKLVQRANN